VNESYDTFISYQLNGSSFHRLPSRNSPKDRDGLCYAEHCESCHGANMAGGQAPSMADDNWEYGGTDADIRRVVSAGIEEAGMPAFGDVIQGEQLSDLVT